MIIIIIVDIIIIRLAASTEELARNHNTPSRPVRRLKATADYSLAPSSKP